MAAYRDKSPHFLHDTFLGLLKHLLDGGLVRCLDLIDLVADGFAIGACKCDALILLVQVELNISILKEMVVDADGARHRLPLNINDPLGLPLSSPAVPQIQVDAADIYLQITSLVET